MRGWKAGNDRTAELPLLRMFHQSFLSRIINDVKADFGEGIALALFGSKDVIMRLVLEAVRAQLGREVFAQKFHSILLIRVVPQPHPDQMNVVRHQAVGRAEKTLARGGVEHDFAKAGMKCVTQPARAALGNGHRPMDDRVGLVIFPREALQIEAPICA